ncbi:MULTISPECIES: energy transducer TonB [unclassified Burkholderia]|uniref:energy transducer TonB n=1 Tax=unclassified Burkholderia TaxID=2613784 RepID=UPI0005CEE0EC|nr:MULTISPECIES: energy transducer TonB [unclassified Burkholderia]MCR4471768.1 TonB family protein [Burkholderia sp. SCN-KJ]RQR29013.1 energy transducer TonB [Burkholderia sp. Bp9131]RQR60570.1 energy transducer TonB [Burkholderia sp. Bp9015]RQR70082.1 energy transducer TonB [Burkholderia sp. Bp9011]RQR83003.1 energy transducer TonB [Burkholderia sp. Bp9010]
MQASQSAPAGVLPAAPRMNPRVITVAVGVLAAHAIMLAAAWLHRNAPPPKEIEVQSITAQLIPPAPAAQPVAVQSAAQPAPPKPVPREKPKVEPKPVQKAVKPTPQPVAQSPSPTPAPAAADPTPAPAAPAPAAPAAAPGPARETMQVSAPKNVSALSCNFVKPTYPSMSRRRGETGTAYVHFIIGVTGKIESVQLQKSSGYPRLDEAALDATRASTCPPYIENGQAIRAAHTLPFNFTLDD